MVIAYVYWVDSTVQTYLKVIYALAALLILALCVSPVTSFGNGESVKKKVSNIEDFKEFHLWKMS